MQLMFRERMQLWSGGEVVTAVCVCVCLCVAVRTVEADSHWPDSSVHFSFSLNNASEKRKQMLAVVL